MRKIYTLALATVGILAGGGTLKAEPYSCDFNESITINENSHTLPAGWDHLVDGYEDGWSYDDPGYVDYTYLADGGVDNSGAIKAGDQENVYCGYYSGATYDLLITPLVSGEVTMMVKQDRVSGTIKFYKVTPKGSSWQRGELITSEGTLTTDAFREVKIKLTEPTRIGIRLSNVVLDNFTAASKEIYRHASMVSVTNTTVGGINPSCDEENKYTVSADVTIKNDGEVTLTPDTEGLYIAIATSESSTSLKNPVMFEPYARLTENLEPGESVTLQVSATIPYDEARGEYESGATRYPVGCYFAYSEEFKSLGWMEPKPYKPDFRFRDMNGSNVNTVQSYGRLSSPDEAVSKSYKICNIGAAPMEVTAVTCPEGFVMTGCPETPFTIAANGEQEITITLNTDVPATLNSELVISCTGLEDFKLGFTGIVLDATKWAADLEDQWLPTEKQMPDGSYAEDGWSVKEFSSSGSKCALYYAYNNLEKHDYFATPLLEFAEGESFAFDLARVNYYSEMDVLYSTDRKNWISLKHITNDEITNDKESGYGSNYKYSSFAVTLPAGNYYIGFDANYCYLDNLYGGKKVDVAHDMMLSAATTPPTGMVNYDYTAKGTVRNILNKEETVTVSLFVNDEAVAEQEVNVGPVAKDASFEISFLSNEIIEAGKAKFVLTVDEYTTESDEWDFTIGEETIVAEVKTPCEKSSTNTSAPWSSNYNKTNTDIVYPVDYIGLTSGSKITGFKFYGYNTAETTATFDVWIANTDKTIADGTVVDTGAMTKIVDAKSFSPVKIGSTYDNDHEILNIEFDNPFEYAGGNLEIYITISHEWKSGFNAMVIEDEATKGCMSSRKSDGDITAASWSSYKLPVTGFAYAAEPKQLYGVITGEKKIDGATDHETVVVAATGAVITLTEYVAPTEPEVTEPESGNENSDATNAPHKAAPAKNVVVYSTTTDENGEYALPVLQSDKSYTLTIEHPDFLSYTHETPISLADQSMELNIKLANIDSGVDNVYADAIRKGIYSISGVRIDKEASELEPGVYVIDGKKIIVTRK